MPDDIITARPCDCEECRAAEPDPDDYCRECGEPLDPWSGDCNYCAERDQESEYEGCDDERRYTLDAGIDRPLWRILRNGSRLWSAEVECNGVREYGLDLPSGRRFTPGGVVDVVDDCTCDVEVHLSRMTDGDMQDAELCAAVYESIRYHGGYAGYNAGHHVHVDAGHLVALGVDVATSVVQAAATIGAACDSALYVLAASGYDQHRHDAGNDYGHAGWHLGADAMRNRYALHGSRLGYNLDYGQGNGRGATVEYRLPNATLYAERAHAHVAVAMGLLDLAERAMLTGDRKAQDALRNARERVGADLLGQYLYPIGKGGYTPSYHPAGLTTAKASWDEQTAAEFLAEHVAFSGDSYRALSAACATAPASPEHKRTWETAVTCYAA
jgi:hypothetical protein